MGHAVLIAAWNRDIQLFADFTDQTWTNLPVPGNKTSSPIGLIHDARMSRSFANYLAAMLTKMIE